MSKFYGYVCRLGNIKRFPAIRLVHEYSGAEHSYRVAMMGMMFADEYNRLNPTKPINVEEVMRKALLHDLEETITNDVPTPVKEIPGVRDMLKTAAESIMQKMILSHIPNESIRQLYFKMWKEDKDDATGDVISVADKLEAFSKAAYEVHRHNCDMEEPLMNIYKWFTVPKNMELVNRFPSAKSILDEALSYPEVQRLIKTASEPLKVVGQ